MSLTMSNAKISKSNLGYLGVDFQYRLISAFFEEPRFFKDMYQIIDQNMFTESYLKTIVGVMKEYYAKYESTASYDIIMFKLKEKANTENDLQCFTEVIDKLKNTTTEGIQEIENLAQKFFMQQNWIRVSNEIRRIAGDGDISKYDECQRLMEEAMSVGKHTEEAESPLDNIEGDLSKDNVVTIPTGVGKLDEVLGGGIDKGKIGLIIAPSSFGKVQPFDAKIATPDGFKDMKDIKVGDKVIGRDGMPHNVTGVFPHKNWQFYRVRFSDGVSCECGKEHLWAVNNGSKKTYKVLSLEEIMENGLLTSKGNGYRFNIPVAEPVHFKEKPLDVDPYLFGTFIGNKYIEPDYLYNSLDNRVSLLNGIMDMHGRCNKNGTCSFITKTKKSADDVRTLVLSLGGFAIVLEKGETEYEVIMTFLSPTIPVFRIKEKQDKVRYNIKGKNKRFIQSIELSRVCDGQCIKVDAEDELYLTNDFIVTHNTSMTTGFSAYEASYKCEANNNNGFKVLQIVFEDSNRDINRKYFSRLTQVETKDINKSEETTQKVKELLLNHPDFELIKNNVKVMHLDSGEYSASDIKEIVKRKINEGFKPDVLIIDYFECLESEKGTMKLAKWEQENKTMRKLETMAKQLDLAIWLPTQGNRGSFSSEVVTMDQSGGTIGKIQIAQVVLSVARSVDDIKNQRATIAVLKNRSGSAGIVLNGIKFDNGTCTISDDNTIDFDSALAYNDYAEEQENNARQSIIDEIRGPHRNYIE